MNKTVVLRLNRQINNGGYHVIAEVGNEGHASEIEVQGSLPILPTSLVGKIKRWRESILNLEENIRLKVKKLPKPFHTSNSIHNKRPLLCHGNNVEEFDELKKQISYGINSWLGSNGFSRVVNRIWEELSLDDNIQIIIRTDDIQLCYIPWSCWRVLEAYTNSEISFSLSNESYSHKNNRSTRRLEGLKILAVF